MLDNDCNPGTPPTSLPGTSNFHPGVGVRRDGLGCDGPATQHKRLTEEDAQAIAYEIPEVQVAAPTSRTSGQLVYGNTNWSTTILGVTNDYLEAREWPLASGAPF